MYKARVIKPFIRRGEIIQPGIVLEVPSYMVQKMTGYIEVLPYFRQDPPTDWRPKPRARFQDGELRTTGVFTDLAAEIVKLTANDLPLQRRLLLEHCDLYGPDHFWILAKAWKDRVESLRVAQRLSERDAEAQAAQEMSLMAWLPELRESTIH